MLESLRPRRFDRRIAVRAVVAVAVASIATGVAAILTEPAVRAEGAVGAVQIAAEFSGTVVGFALLVAAWGMRRGYRVAFVAAAGLVALSGAHGIVQFRALAVPLVVLSAGVLVVLAATSERFTRSSALDATQVGALVAIVGVFCYGTAGAYALRAQFDGIETVVDAVYFTAVTGSTVGYGDVHATTETARLFAVSLVVLGPATLAATVGGLFAPLIEARLRRTGRRATGRRDPETGSVSDPGDGDETDDGDEPERGTRIAVLGFDATVAPIVDALADRVSVAVATTEEAASGIPGSVTAIVGDPTATRTLERAALETCDAILVGADGVDTEGAVAAARSRTDARIAVVTGRRSETADRSDESFEPVGTVSVIRPETALADAAVAALLDADEGTTQSSASARSQSG